MGFKKKHMALGLVAIMVVVMTSACTLTGKAVGESLKTNDIPDGEAVLGQAVSEKKDLSEMELQEEVPSVSVSSSDMIGADMPEIIYNDANRLIVSCWKGVFVYDKNEHKIIRSLDRVALKCDCTQGDMYTSVHASDDGKYVYLDCEYYELQYQFDVDNNKLEKLEYKEDRWKTTDFFNKYGDWFKEDTTDVAWYMDPKGEKVYTNLVHMDGNLMCVGYYESKELAPTEEFPDPVQPQYIFTDEYTPQIDKKDELTRDDYSCWADICLDRIEGDVLIGHYSASTYKVYRYNVAMGNVCGFGSTEVYVKINSKTVFKIFDGKKDKEGHQKATKVSEKRFREYIKKHNNPGKPSYGIYDSEDPEHSTATRPGGPAYGGLRFGVEVEKGNCVSVEQLYQA